MSIEILWRLLVRRSSPVSKGRIWGKKIVTQISRLFLRSPSCCKIHIDKLQSPMVRLKKKMILLSWYDNHQRIQSFHYLPGNDHISHLGKVNINLQTYLGICDRSQEGTPSQNPSTELPRFYVPFHHPREPSRRATGYGDVTRLHTTKLQPSGLGTSLRSR